MGNKNHYYEAITKKYVKELKKYNQNLSINDEFDI